MKKNITEELNRMKLFMGYNSKLTLKENESKLNINLLTEGKGDIILKTIFKDFEKTALKTAAEDAIKYDREILQDLKGFRSAEAIAKAFAEGTMKSGEAVRVIKGFIDNPAITKELEERAIKIITNQEKFISKYENVTRYAKPEYMEKELVNRGYTKQQAEKLTKAFREERADFFKEPKPVKPEPVKPEPVKPEPVKPTEPKKWTGKTWDWIKRNWKKLALGAGALWLLWYWFKDEQKIFPTCLLNLMSEKDLEKSSLGEGEIYVSKLNISDLDKLGGGKFSTNGDFESILGGYEGTWEKEGETFLIVVGGQNYTFECKGTTPPVPPIPPPIPPKPEDNKCKTLPMKAGCIDDSGEGIINKIQECLGVAVTGKLDSVTIQKLKEKYGVEILDQSTYDKIIKDCYETIDDRKFTEI